MPNIFGASILDLLNQGGQFLAGRNEAKRQRQIEDEKRAQDQALQQALLEYRKAQTQHEQRLSQPQPGNGERIRLENGNVGLLYDDGTVKDTGTKWVDAPDKPQYVTGPDNKLVVAAPGVAVRPPQGPQPQYVTGPDNKLVVAAPGVEVRPPSGSTGGLGSVTQKKTQALYLAGKGGYDALEKVLADAGQQAPGWLEQQLAKAPLGIGNVVATPFVRQMNQAANQLADSWLRFTSGAAVPETEVARFATAFLPLAGDENDPVTTANKAKARATAVEAMRLAAGIGLDVPSGLQQAGIDPTDLNAVAAWIQSQASGAASTDVPAASNPFEARRQQRQGGVR